MARASFSILFVASASIALASFFACSTDEPSPPCSGPWCVAAEAGASDTSAPPPDAATASDGAAPPRPERVLFVGNSYTEFNDLPAVVREIGAATGTPFETDAIVVGSATLYDHYTKTGAKERLASTRPDAVVLQGQSLEALGGEGAFATYARSFGDAAKEAGARAVWFATWARGPGGPEGLRGEAVASRIEQAYTAAALEKGGTVARVGAAFYRAQVRYPEIALYLDDQSHPTREGTLLAACTIAQALGQKTPVVPRPAPLGLTSDVAEKLCAVAADVRCLEGRELCGGACVTLGTDTKNCGTCGKVCAAGDPCRNGKCGCPDGLTACALVCTSTLYDGANCGACGKACAPGRSCNSGTCTCSNVDVVTPAPVATLAAIDPTCTELGLPACDAAARRLCVSGGCATSSFGPPSGHAPNDQAVACLAGIAPVDVPYATLAALDARCDGTTERHGEGCATAMNRHCVGLGAVGGTGFPSASGTAMSVTCLPSARAIAITVDATTLQGYVSRCVPHPTTCSAGAWNLCTSLGFAAGFGPVESSGAARTVVCLRD